MKIASVKISLCDPLNEEFGYQIRIVGIQGYTLLWTSKDPVTGKDLLTYEDALQVAIGYARPQAEWPDPMTASKPYSGRTDQGYTETPGFSRGR